MSPASYRAAPPRVGNTILIAAGSTTKLRRINYYFCAFAAASRADFNLFCARSYAAKSPFARAANPSLYAAIALAIALDASDEDPPESTSP
jgi:hypothetical protein